MRKAFCDWAWISVGFGWRVGFSRARNKTDFGWLLHEANLWGVRVPLTRHYLSTYRRS